MINKKPNGHTGYTGSTISLFPFRIGITSGHVHGICGNFCRPCKKKRKKKEWYWHGEVCFFKRNIYMDIINRNKGLVCSLFCVMLTKKCWRRAKTEESFCRGFTTAVEPTNTWKKAGDTPGTCVPLSLWIPSSTVLIKQKGETRSNCFSRHLV